MRRKGSRIVKLKPCVLLLAVTLICGAASAQMTGGVSGGMMSGGSALNSALEIALTGDQEVPAVTTEASGSATVSISEGTLTVTGEFDGLSSPQVGGHVHMAAAGATGEVLYPLNISAAEDGLSGVFSLSVSLTPEQVTAYEAGELYLNIHTEMNPNGELRGQIVLAM